MNATNKKYKYAIVGGGAAGCTLAYHLTRNHHDVVLFERQRGLGGLASAVPFGHTQLDRFYHHIFTSDTHVQAFADRMGLYDKLQWCDSSVAFEADGRLYPFTTPTHLLRFKPLPLLSRLRVGFSVLAERRRDDYKELEGITAEDYIIRHMGEKAYRILWEPLLRSKFGDRYREVSAVWFWGKIKLRGGTRSKGGSGECLGYIKDGWGQIYEGLGQAIEHQGGDIRYGEMVKQIEETASGLRVHTRKSQEDFDRVIVTPSLPNFVQMVPSLPDEYKNSLSAIPYQANMTMILGIERSLSPYYWLNVTDPDSPFVAVIEHTNLFNDPGYGDLIPLYISRYISRDHPLYKTRVPEIKDLFYTQMEKLFPRFSREQIHHFTFSRADYAQPVIALQYAKKRPSFTTPMNNLYLCTMVQIYPEDRGMNYAMKIAEELLIQLGELDNLSA
ncbi:FAD-dependent oxidoreductase [bacterium]|nr:FAD-dependent oxidoreductase [bacterium]